MLSYFQANAGAMLMLAIRKLFLIFGVLLFGFALIANAVNAAIHFPIPARLLAGTLPTLFSHLLARMAKAGLPVPDLGLPQQNPAIRPPSRRNFALPAGYAATGRAAGRYFPKSLTARSRAPIASIKPRL